MQKSRAEQRIAKMKSLIKKIDIILCAYLGLDNEEVSPNTIKIVRGNLFISNTKSFKRHSYSQLWDEFVVNDFEQVHQPNKEKLGIAIGKAIAKNLVVSFDQMQIQKEKN